MAVGAGMGALMGMVEAKTRWTSSSRTRSGRCSSRARRALFMVVERSPRTRPWRRCTQYGGTVLKSSLSNEAQQELQDALHGEGSGQ